jgi:glycerophosphoryl diester phosphodiesterase
MVMIVGHRGARNLWPENSLGGFRRLLALDVESVEFDVHETRDGRFVVIHDPTLDRTTYGTGAIRDLDAAAVVASRLRPAPAAPAATAAAFADECVPTLDAVLDLLSATPLELHIEIKADALGEVDPRSVERLVRVVHRHGLERQSILTCFVPEVLDCVRAAWPGGRTLASLDHRSAEMLGGLRRALERYAAMDGCIVAVHKDLLAASWQRCFDALGAERLGVWVLNEPAELERWLGMPLRQITTDRPDLALAARSARTTSAAGIATERT